VAVAVDLVLPVDFVLCFADSSSSFSCASPVGWNGMRSLESAFPPPPLDEGPDESAFLTARGVRPDVLRDRVGLAGVGAGTGAAAVVLFFVVVDDAVTRLDVERVVLLAPAAAAVGAGPVGPRRVLIADAVTVRVSRSS